MDLLTISVLAVFFIIIGSLYTNSKELKNTKKIKK
jgi:hypothetical protein